MRRNYLGATAAAVVAILSGCAPPSAVPPQQHSNADHPTYGQAEYNRDLADCQTANTHTVPGGGYSEHKEVDEKGVNTCLASRGWR